jgi:predicted nucleic acid-binding protein
VETAAVVLPETTPRVVPDDPEDDKLVAVALAAGAVPVSNDAHLLAVAGHERLKVVRPADLR